MMSQSNNACVVIDIKPSAITDFMEEIDIGDGSIIGFVTPGGRELVVENVEEGKKVSFRKREMYSPDRSIIQLSWMRQYRMQVLRR